MRTNKRVVLVSRGDKTETYNPDTMEWEGGGQTETVTPAFVMDLGRERSMREFGHYVAGRKIVIFRYRIDDPVEIISIEGKPHAVISVGLEGMSYVVERDRHVGV